MSDFKWDRPQSNYSMLPHQFNDVVLPTVSTISELKVILYVLRHTWGFQEYDTPKKMTLDEICNGRKYKDGKRMDSGTQLSTNAAKAGIASAVEHGFMVVEEDAKDKARIKRYYMLNSGGQTLIPRGSNFDGLPSNIDPRTEKETIEKETEDSYMDASASAPSETTKQRVTKDQLTPMIDEIVRCWYNGDPYDKEFWTRIGKSNGAFIRKIARQLVEQKVSPDDVGMIAAYCKSKYDNPGIGTLSKYAYDALMTKRLAAPKHNAPVVAPPDVSTDDIQEALRLSKEARSSWQ